MCLCVVGSACFWFQRELVVLALTWSPRIALSYSMQVGTQPMMFSLFSGFIDLANRNLSMYIDCLHRSVAAAVGICCLLYLFFLFIFNNRLSSDNHHRASYCSLNPLLGLWWISLLRSALKNQRVALSICQKSWLSSVFWHTHLWWVSHSYSTCWNLELRYGKCCYELQSYFCMLCIRVSD
jgi:hypothetical protein